MKDKIIEIFKKYDNNMSDVSYNISIFNSDKIVEEIENYYKEVKLCNAPISFIPCNVKDEGICTLPIHCDYKIKPLK